MHHDVRKIPRKSYKSRIKICQHYDKANEHQNSYSNSEDESSSEIEKNFIPYLQKVIINEIDHEEKF